MQVSCADPRSQAGIRYNGDELLLKISETIHRFATQEFADIRKFSDVRSIFPFAWKVFERCSPTEPDSGASKSIQRANEEMRKGNKSAKKGDLFFARHQYNLSLMFCPSVAPEEHRDGPCRPSSLSVLYAKRSEVNFRLQWYQFCIFDVMQALRFQFSPEKEHELFERMGVCCEQLHELDRAKLSYEQALTCVGSGNSEVSKRINIRLRKLSDRTRQLTVLPSLLTSHIGAASVHHWKPAPPLSYGNSDDCEVSSSAIAFCANRGGWYATRDIKPGDVLIVENAYAHEVNIWELLGSQSCDNCMEIIVCLTPCDNCSLASYCSQRCQHEAWERYHRVECAAGPYIEPLQELTLLRLMSRLYVTFCADYVRQKSYGTSLIKNFVSIPEAKLPHSQKKVAHSKAILYSIYACLAKGSLGHSKPCIELEKRFTGVKISSGVENSECDNLRETLFAGIINSCFQRCRRVMSYLHFEPARDQLIATLPRANQPTDAARIAKIDIEASTPNLHLLEALLSCLWEKPSDGMVSCGYALYPQVSTIRHSCFPNVCDVYYGTKCVIKALRNIRNGEEIVICNGAPLSATDFRARQRLLRIKAIDCRCAACVDKLSAIDFTDRPLFRCPHCGVGVEESRETCWKCGNNVAAEMTRFGTKWKLFSQGLSQWMKPSVGEESTSFVVDLMSEVDASIVDPHRCRPFLQNVEQLRTYFQKMANFSAKETVGKPFSEGSTSSSEERGDAFVNSFYNIRFK